MNKNKKKVKKVGLIILGVIDNISWNRGSVVPLGPYQSGSGCT